LNTTAVLVAIICVSVILNGLLFIQTLKFKKAPAQTLELRQFASDLFRGEALLRVTRIDPADILLKSPRGRQ
jgi:hypothetical protein